MKRNILLMLVPFAFLVSLTFIPKPPEVKPISEAPPEYAKCYGRTPCNACSNCSQCKYCSGGGTCGVCERKPSSSPGSYGSSRKKSSEAETGQCRAKTKKGTRCSRNARSGGYCWQHGG